MGRFARYFRMSPEDVTAYAVEVLQFFAPGETLDCQEIGDGNINYVFRLVSRETGKSLVIKQSDTLLRTSGRPLDQHRSAIEAEILRLEGELAPGFVPEIVHYDPVMAALSMEDISAYKNLRKELAAGRVYAHLGDNLSEFLALSLLPTTDLVLDRQEKKRRVAFFQNPQLCDISEDLVLTEPYWDYKGRNVLFPGNEDFVRSTLYEDPALHGQVAMLRNNFMNNAQALIHGDLHSGSIFANENGIKIIDPEFAFYGPMGYDIGNVVGNLFFSLANWRFTRPEAADTCAALERTIRETWDQTFLKLDVRYGELVTFPLYRTPEFLSTWLGGVRADACGYAGTEIIRRVVGDSKVAEVTAVTDPSQRIPMERALIRLGVRMIQERNSRPTGQQLLDWFDQAVQAGE